MILRGLAFWFCVLGGLVECVASADPGDSRRVPAVLVEGPRVAWARCAAMALFGEAFARRAQCASAGGKSHCSFSTADGIAIQWRESGHGDVSYVGPAGNHPVGTIAPRSSVDATFWHAKDADGCSIVVRGNRLLVEWRDLP